MFQRSRWPARGGTIATLVHTHDWARTPLGPVVGWPAHLRMAVDLCLDAGFPTALWWGDKLVQIYNDACLPLLGARHPATFGVPASVAWPRLWPTLGPLAEQVFGSGAPVTRENLTLIPGEGGPHDAPLLAVTFSLSAVRDPDGQIAGLLVTGVETAGQVRAEAGLRSSEARLAAIFAQAAVGLSEIALDGRFLRVNDELCRMLGRSREEVLAIGVPDVTHPEDLPASLEAFGHVVATGAMASIDKRYRHPDGTLVWANSSLSRLTNGAGQATSVLVVTFDLSSRKATEAGLHASEARFRTLAATIPQLIWTCTPAGDVDYLSEQWADYTGLPLEQLHAGGWRQVVHPDDRHDAANAWARSLRVGTPLEIKHRLRHHTGMWRWQLTRGTPSHTEAGAITHWVGTCTDIHASESGERNRHFLLELETHLSLLVEPEAIERAVLERLGVYLDLSCCYFGWSDGEYGTVAHEWRREGASVLGTYRLRDFFAPEVVAQLGSLKPMIIEDVATDLRTNTLTALFQVRGTGAFVIIPVLSQHGLAGGIVIASAQPRAWQAYEVQLLREIATRVWPLLEKARAQMALRASEARLQVLYEQEQAARAEAEEASRLKDEFLATVSHELRTPLTAFLGYAQLLQSRPRDEAYIARMVERMVQSARTQAQLIEDLLDVSRIVSGKLRIAPQPIDMVPVVYAALDTVALAIETKRLQLTLDLPAEAGPIIGDAGRLQQVVWNLLANATKFTPPGGAVTVRLEQDEDAVELTVSDSGQGIAPDFLPFVFDRFRQADSSTRRAHGGLGLGLSIVRHLVELHGGTVRATSDGVGEGAAFTVRLPLVRTVASSHVVEDARRDCPPELRGLRVLVVDDHPDLLELLDDILTPCGAIVYRCLTAHKALEEVRAWRPDVLIADIAMPVEDGYWLIRQVRALAPHEGGLTPGLALTAYVREGDRARALAEGFQRYLSKPVEPSDLLEVVAELARGDADEGLGTRNGTSRA